MATKEEIEAARARLEGLQQQLRATEGSVFDNPQSRSRGVVGGTIDALAQGGTFGLADEIEAGIRAPFAENPFPGATFKDRFNNILFDLERKRSAFRETNPGLSATSEIAGGVGQGIGALRGIGAAAPGVTRAINSVPVLPRLAGIGAIEGAAFGAGSANPGERSQGALEGALTAGIFSPAIGGASSLIAGTVRPVVQKLINSVSRTPRSKAIGLVTKALQRDDITPDEASALLRRLGRDGTLADIGENLGDLTRTATSLPSGGLQSARIFLDARQEGQRLRLVQAARNAGATSNFDDDVIRVINNAESRAAPLYQEAYSQVLDVTPSMAELLKRPALQKALNQAKTKVRNLGFSDEIVDDVTDVRFMDLAKRSLDDQIGVAQRKGQRDQVRVLQGIKRDFLNEIDSQVPAYAQAREIFSGEAAVRDAVEVGRNALRPSVSSNDIAESVSQMTQSELNGARHGLLTAIVDQLDSTQNITGAANRFARVPKLRSALQEIFPDQQALQDFLNQAVTEGRFAQTRNTVLGGSPTSRIAASQRAAASESGPIDLFFDATTGGSNTLLRGLKNAVFKEDIEPEVAEALVDILLNPDVIPQNIRQPIPQRLGDFLIPRLNSQDFTGAVTGGTGASLVGPSPPSTELIPPDLINLLINSNGNQSASN
jgi:hypothetical protein